MITAFYQLCLFLVLYNNLTLFFIKIQVSHVCAAIRMSLQRWFTHKSSPVRLPSVAVFNNKGHRGSIWVGNYRLTGQLQDVAGSAPRGTCEHHSSEPRGILSAFCWHCKCRISHSKQKDWLVVVFGSLPLKTLPMLCTGTTELNWFAHFPCELPMKGQIQHCCCGPMSNSSSVH